MTTTDMNITDPSRTAGSAASNAAASRTLLATLLYAAAIVLAWVVLQLGGLGNTPFHTKGEAREGLVVWEMTHDGGWILPRRNGVELPSKPPLFHWLGALTALAHGRTDEWSIRFPSAALSGIALLGVFAAGCALWNPRAGLLSTLALMTMFEWARAATNARVDMTLTFGLLLAFLSLLFFLRTTAGYWLLLLYLGITLAVLGKGPVGVVLPGLAALAMCALHRDFSPLRRMRLAAGTLAVTLGAGTWYVLALFIGGYAFFRKQILGENLFTFVDDPEFRYGGHRHPASYLLGALLLGLLPWTPFFAGVVARLWRERFWRRWGERYWREPGGCARADARLYLLVWIVVVFGFYSLAASKRSVYLLALYPAAALLLGWWWDEQSRAHASEDRWLARVAVAIGWTLLIVVAVLCGLVLAEAFGLSLAGAIGHWLRPTDQPFLTWTLATIREQRWLLLGALLLAAAALYGFVRAGRAAAWIPLFACLFLGSATLTDVARLVILPGIAAHASLRDFMAEVRRVVGPQDDLSFYKTFDYGAVFYWHGHIPDYAGGWNAAGPRYLLMDKGEWERSHATAGQRYEAVRLSGPPAYTEHGELVLLRRLDSTPALDP